MHKRMHEIIKTILKRQGLYLCDMGVNSKEILRTNGEINLSFTQRPLRHLKINILAYFR